MNKGKKQKILMLLLFSMIFLPMLMMHSDFISQIETNESQNQKNNVEREIESSAVITSLIRINGSATGANAHNWTWAQEQGYVSPGGDGSQGNPYIIENLEIDGQNSHSGIEIVDSRWEMAMPIYFRIENNIINNVGATNSRSAGIKLYKTKYGTIKNNIISSSKAGNYGIHLVGYSMWMWPPYTDTTSEINITANTITETERGIFIEERCEDIKVSENIAKYNTLAGIYIAKGCLSIDVTNNILTDNDVFGIADTGSNNYKPPGDYPELMYGNMIKNNTIYNNAYGFYLAQTRAATICYNNISSNTMNGMYISGASWNRIANNTIANNVDKGILMVMGPSGSFRNMIWGNEFLGNGEHAVELTNAPPFPIMDDMYMMTSIWQNNWSWYESGIMLPIIGNKWDNYTELGAEAVDADDDAIGDIPYSFIGNEDPKPNYNDGIEGNIIFINGSAMPNPYNWTWASGRFWCSGSGSPMNPYIIGPNSFWDGKIDAWQKPIGISIVESSITFKIEGITITNSSEAGIKLDDVRWIDSQLVNNNISSNDGHGISLRVTNDINITNNIITDNKGTGIYINNDTGSISYRINVIDNTISNNGIDGVYIGENSDDTLIRDNTIADNGRYGVNIDQTTGGPMGGCNFTTLHDNDFSRNVWENARDTAIDTVWYKDTFNIKRGNYWHDYDGDDVDDDGIGDTPYTDIVPSGEDKYPIWDDGLENGSLFIDDTHPVFNWTWASKRLYISGSGMSWDPYVIENVKFNGSDSKSAITIKNSAVYFRIENCTLVDIGSENSGSAGIYLYNVQYGDLINNTFSTKYNGNYGIHLDKCDNNPITKINITDHLIEPNPIKFKYGIYLDKSGSTIDNYIVIDGNNIRNNYVGIFLNNDSRFNNITNNKITGNTNVGIFINDSSADTKIYYNDIIGNGNGTIIDNGAMTNNIIDNKIEDNTDFGLYINSSGNSIYYNYFIDNGINAQDDSPIGFINTWYKDFGFTGRGNFWSNYTTLLYSVDVKDAGDDGIGDIAYNLTGIAEAQDSYPIFDDGHNGSRVIINGAVDWPMIKDKTWCTGSGIIDDPYVISGLVINGTLNGSCIYIHDSNAYLIIKNCVLFNSSATASPEPAGGIRLVEVSNTLIINNNIINNDGHGIILRSGFMEMDQTSNITIRDNLIENNNGTGIYLNGSYVHDTLIDNNTINSNGINGISIFDNAHDTIVSNNILYNNTRIGIAITNFIPPMPTGHWEYPPPDYFPVWVLDPWDYNKIINNTITLGDTGIGLESSMLVEISGNYITRTESNGIATRDFESTNLTITDNKIYNNDQYGINIGWDSPSFTGNNYILENNISNNGDTGIILQQCYDSTFSDNIIDENSIGIGLAYLNSYNYFTDNLILNNVDRGLAIFDLSCENNKIYDNNFTDNGINAEDLGIGNQWYIDTLDLQAGNYWSDYTGNDTGDDGIGDTEYDNIGGFMKPKDYYPKWWDAPDILKTLPLDNSQFPAEIDPAYEIKINEGLGKVFWYEIYTMPSMTLQDTSQYMMLNGNLGEIVSGKIEHDMWSDLNNGTYKIRFYVNDSQSMVSYTDVTVEKLSAVPPGTVSDGGSDGGGTDETTTSDEDGLPWYIQAAMTGAVSASVGLIIKQSYSSAKKRRIILEKIHENFARVDNLETFLKDKLAYEDWEKIQEPWQQYQKDQITEREMIKKSKKTLGKRFTELFIPHKKSRRRT